MVSISVCLPVYNASRYLHECIDSILKQTFTDFELLIVDDGSTDNSREIVRSYSDSRIQLIENRHDYIASLNLLLDTAKGKYIARMDADDVMLPERLQLQYDYMEMHHDIGILGGGLRFFGKQQGLILQTEGDITLMQMLNGCCIAHPTVMMRTDVIRLYNLHYNEGYIYAEDYHFWLQALKCGIRMYNMKEILVNYRTSDSQVSSIHSKKQAETARRIQTEIRIAITEKEREVANEIRVLPPSNNKLTVVMPFLNEGVEVENTVKSIRETAGYTVDIIVVNDCSEDRSDYEKVLAPYQVHYIYNIERIGAAASKEKGVQHVSTPYFLLLDAHMRFYDSYWPISITNELDADNERLLCCQSIGLEIKDGIVVNNGEFGTFGAFLSFEHHEYIPGIKWNKRLKIQELDGKQIPAVLGAGYATSKSYWNRLKGYQGLSHYGCEEAYISIKAWLEGGGCWLLPDVSIGHIYRKKMPYSFIHARMVYNYLAIVETLFPSNLRCLAHSVAIRKDLNKYNDAIEWIKCNQIELQKLRKYYRENFIAHDFNFIMAINSLASEIESSEKEITCKQLGEVIDFVYSQSQLDTAPVGLCNGLMGSVILLCEYSRYVNESSFESLAEPLFERVCETIEGEHPITFNTGICGIGWGILYLQAHGFLDDNMDKELAIIDRMVMERDVMYTNDDSIKSGLGGIMAYVVNRIAQNHRLGRKISDVFPIEYIEKLKKRTSPMIKTNNIIDYRVRSLAMQVQMINSSDFEFFPPMWNEVVHLPLSLPTERSYWTFDISSAIGYGISRIKQLKNIE